MKTLQDLYKEVMASDELKKAFAQAAKDNKVADFLKEHGSDATEEELKAFFAEKAKDDKPLSEDDLENVAGGGCGAVEGGNPGKPGIGFSIGTGGWGCVISAAAKKCNPLPVL
ncbi:MAG: Nif11-like leader peptide family RiPP precursor [Treponema sp.]|nr:Nif11-like leader peptide family RiPP precursor [Treponema sp.]